MRVNSTFDLLAGFLCVNVFFSGTSALLPASLLFVSFRAAAFACLPFDRLKMAILVATR